MPFDTTHRIHPSWAEHHMPASQDSMNAVVTITDGTTGSGWDPVTGPTDDTPIVVYTGPASVTYKPVASRTGDAVGQQVTVRDVIVAIPRDACPPLTDTARIHVNAVDGNAPQALAGRTLTVQSTAYSSHALEQVIDACDDQNNQGA